MKAITPADRLALIGLFTLASTYNKKLIDIEEAVDDIVNEDVSGGHVSDAVYHYTETDGPIKAADNLIERLKITVSTAKEAGKA